MASWMVDVNLVQTEATNSSSSMSTLADQRCRHSDHFGGHPAVLDKSSFDLNDVLFPDSNMLPWPLEFSTDFGLEEFCTGPPTLATTEHWPQLRRILTLNIYALIEAICI